MRHRLRLGRDLPAHRSDSAARPLSRTSLPPTHVRWTSNLPMAIRTRHHHVHQRNTIAMIKIITAVNER